MLCVKFLFVNTNISSHTTYPSRPLLHSEPASYLKNSIIFEANLHHDNSVFCRNPARYFKAPVNIFHSTCSLSHTNILITSYNPKPPDFSWFLFTELCNSLTLDTSPAVFRPNYGRSVA